MFRDLIGKGVEICNIGLQQGYIKDDGSVSTSGDTDHSKWVTTDFIEGGRDFLIHLNEGFFVNRVSIYDKNKKLMCKSYLSSRGAAFHQCTEYSYHLHKNYLFRLGFVHDGTIEPTWAGSSDPLTPDQDITPSDDIVKDFFRVDLNYFTPVASEDPNYEQALRRVNHLTLLESTNHDGTFNHFGIKYSDQNETPGRVGFEVSPYSYQTAVHNPRSYYWTEDTLNHTSQYGNQYYNNNSLNSSSCWYGVNCSNSVDWVLGYQKALHFARNYLAGQSTSTLNTTEIVPESDFSNVKPLDIIVKQSHVWIIVALYKDATGTVRFVRCAESGGGTPAYSSNIYSTESLLARKTYGTSITDLWYQFTRLPSGPSQAIEEPTVTYVANDSLTEDFTPNNYNEDICMCKGDKVAFMWGDKIFANVKRANGWEAVDLRKWNEANQEYETIKTYDITSGTTYPNQILAGDWIDVNMTYLFPVDGNQYGKYIAVATSEHEQVLNRYDPWLVPSDSSLGVQGFWLDAGTNQIRISKTDKSKTWAIPCKPNTTYTATQDITASENTLLRLAWGKMSNLDFVDDATDMPVFDITNKTTVNDKHITTVTTGAGATYLFVQIGANDERAATCREIIQVYDATTTSIESEPTYFEVLASKVKCYAVNNMSHYDTVNVYGTPLYFNNEANSGFTNSGLVDSSRFKRIAWNFGKTFGWWNLSSGPDATYYHATIRALGEYGVAKYSRIYITADNLYVDANKTAGKNISTAEETYGQVVDNSYRDVVTISNVKPGQIYRYFYKRNLSSAYDNEKAAFYDANGDVVGDVIWLYRPADGNIPETGTYPEWTVTVPANAVTLKFACLKNSLTSANTNITIYNTTPDLNYYNSDYILSNYDMRQDTAQYNYLYANSYREIVTVPCQPGEVYRYSYHRDASSSYAYERYAFLDENGRPLNDTAFSFYDSSSIPPTGSDPYWDITVPANAVAFQIGGIKSNTNKAIYKQ